MFKKTNKILIFSLVFITLFAGVFMVTMINAKASTPLSPNPPPPATGGEYWDFNIGDTFGWDMSYSEDGVMHDNWRRYFRVADFTMEHSPDFWGDFYMVKLSELYFNTTTNSLQDTFEPWRHVSLVNYTFGMMFPTEMTFGPPMLNLFIPKNSSDDLTLHWCGNALIGSLPSFYNPTVQIFGSNRIFISDSWSNYMDLVYDSQGILITGEMGFTDWMDGRERIINWTRTYDFNPIDDVEWPASIGEIFYMGIGVEQFKIEIVDIVNVTEEWGWPMSVVMANISRWDPILEIWNKSAIPGEKNPVEIAFGNELAVIPHGIILPLGSTGIDLSKFFLREMEWSRFNSIEYGDFWVRLDDTINSEYAIYSYFPDGIEKYMFVSNNSIFEEDSRDFAGIGVGEDDLSIWMISDFNPSIASSYFGDSNIENFLGPGAQIGAMEAFEICWMEYEDDLYSQYNFTDCSGWWIDYDVWHWTMDSHDFDREPEDWENIEIYEDPIDWGYDVEKLAWVVPQPVNTYLSGINWGSNVVVTGNEVTIEIDKNDLLGKFPGITGNVTMVLTYDEVSGVLASMLWYTDTMNLVYNKTLAYTGDFDDYFEEDRFMPNMMFYKNMTELIPGISTIDFDVYDMESDYNISIDINVTDDTQLFHAGIPENPTNVSLFESWFYIDLKLNETGNLSESINLTIDYIRHYSEVYSLWYFNESKAVWDWESIPLIDDGISKLTAKLNHTSIYGISLYRGPPPEPFTLSSNAGSPDLDGRINFTWTSSVGAESYDLYVSDCYITEINGTLYQLASRLTNNSIVLQAPESGTFYIVAVAYNWSGETMSNVIEIEVKLPDDRYEDNDVFNDAPFLTPGHYPDLILQESDDDWYKFFAWGEDFVELEINFNNSDGNLDLELYDSSHILLNGSYSSFDEEWISYKVPDMEFYYIKVYNNDMTNVSYELEIDVYWDMWHDDYMEENDDFWNAWWINPNYYPDLKVVGDDEDWYQLYLNPGDIIDVDIFFDHMEGDLNLELYDPSNSLCIGSYSNSNDEFISYTADIAGDWRIRVYHADGNSDVYYGLDIWLNKDHIDDDDWMEENDDFWNAAPVSDQFYSGLICNNTDEDWYEIYVEQGTVIIIEITFNSMEGNLELELYNSQQSLISSSYSFSGSESIIYNSTSSETYKIRVYNTAMTKVYYDMDIKFGEGILQEVPLGNFYLIFMIISAATLIAYKKRRLKL